MPLLLAAAVASLVSWVPMRWPTADPASLALLAGTPVNCLLLEPAHWSAAFTAAARKKGIAVVGVAGSSWDAGAARLGCGRGAGGAIGCHPGVRSGTSVRHSGLPAGGAC